MHEQRGLISRYTCNVWSVNCFQDNLKKKQSYKTIAYVIYLSHVNAFMTKNDRFKNKM